MIKKLDVTSQDAFSYLRRQLDIGKTLAHNMGQQQIEKGRVFALVPSETSKNSALSFDNGGLYPFDKDANKNKSLIPTPNEATPLVIETIEYFLASDRNNCVLFEEPLASPVDKWVLDSKIEYVRLGSEMFYFFDEYNYAKLRLEKSFKASQGYYSLCTFAEIDKEMRQLFHGQREIEPDILRSYATNVKALIVRAYDGEGYLLWTKSESFEFIIRRK